ncbi:glycoside hydrolase family 89 protein [Pisolithus marmoratus]|nr:glycoside hydrolase family 89 protein [Pisolithus marmoratus]
MLVNHLTQEIMKALIVPLAVGLATLGRLSFAFPDHSASNNANVEGLYNLVNRRIPQHAGAFRFTLTSGNATAFDTFTLRDVTSQDDGCDTQIDIECTSISACARGLYTYVTEFGGVDIWWTGSRLDQITHPLPVVGTPITRSSVVRYRYFFNTVTFSYTTAFYAFEDWELLLDWMALRGINLPLAWVGYEYILVEVFREAGLSDADITGFLSGPAFQAWNRFGNIQGSWTGELPRQWIDDQFALQKKLVSRMVELGMTPVLPSFTGFVPRTFAALYPNASVVVGSQWDGFPPTYTSDSFLEPFDPLFATLQKSFIDKQTAAYGNVSHIYTLDQYNENNPYSGDLSYLANITSATFASLKSADPQATWLMQGWLFFISATFWTNERVQAYLGGVPGNDSMIILDLYSEAQPQWQRLDSYFGKQWIWCQLHDFGGNQGMEGNFANVTVVPIEALSSPGSTMVGMGLTPEGLEGNELVYDALLDQAWSSNALDRAAYVSSWASRRYYTPNLPSVAVDAWQLLSSTVYSNTDPSSQATVKSILELEPALTGLINRTLHDSIPTLVFYDTNTTIVPALKMLIEAGYESEELTSVPEYQYDLVDITRQLLANRFIEIYQSLITVYNSSTSTEDDVSRVAVFLQQLLSDLDRVLLTNSHFLFSKWIGAAKAWSSGNATISSYLEYNARNQISLWGPTGQINDYASKQWGGLVSGYYARRWGSFVQYLVETKKDGMAYNATMVSDMMLEIGEEWDKQVSDSGEAYVGPTENGWVVVQHMVAKYC